jgi:hypothetical protein
MANTIVMLTFNLLKIFIFIIGYTCAESIRAAQFIYKLLGQAHQPSFWKKSNAQGEIEIRDI